MSGNTDALRQIPLIIQIPESTYGASEAKTVEELKQLLIELREILKNQCGPLSFEEAELAEKWGCSLIWLQRERRAAKIKFKRIGNKIHYSRKHIEAYLDSN